MTTKLHHQVREFHSYFGKPGHYVPRMPDHDRLTLRLRLIAEEFCEVLEAAGCEDSDLLLHCINSFIDERSRVDDSALAKLAHEASDLDYVVEGLRYECGFDGEPVTDEIHRANMSKVGSEVRPDGKILKGPNYRPPDVATVLRKQGWNG